jgi:hypothetical protein
VVPELRPLLGDPLSLQQHRVEVRACAESAGLHSVAGLGNEQQAIADHCSLPQGGYRSVWEDLATPAAGTGSPAQFIYSNQRLHLALLELWLAALPLLLQQQLPPPPPQQEQASLQQQAPATTGAPSTASAATAAAANLAAMQQAWPQQEQQRLQRLIDWQRQMDADLQQHCVLPPTPPAAADIAGGQQGQQQQDECSEEEDGQEQQQKQASLVKRPRPPPRDRSQPPPQQQQQQQGQQQEAAPVQQGFSAPPLPQDCSLLLPSLPSVFLEALLVAAPDGCLCAMYAPLIDARKLQLPPQGAEAGSEAREAEGRPGADGAAPAGSSQGGAAAAAASPLQASASAAAAAVLAALRSTPQHAVHQGSNGDSNQPQSSGSPHAAPSPARGRKDSKSGASNPQRTPTAAAAGCSGSAGARGNRAKGGRRSGAAGTASGGKASGSKRVRQEGGSGSAGGTEEQQQQAPQRQRLSVEHWVRQPATFFDVPPDAARLAVRADPREWVADADDEIQGVSWVDGQGHRACVCLLVGAFSRLARVASAIAPGTLTPLTHAHSLHSCARVCMHTQLPTGLRGSHLPAWAASHIAFTDAGLGGAARRAMPGLSLGVGILSGPLTSALQHPEDGGFASYNLHLWGSHKVSGGGVTSLGEHHRCCSALP